MNLLHINCNTMVFDVAGLYIPQHMHATHIIIVDDHSMHVCIPCEIHVILHCGVFKIYSLHFTHSLPRWQGFQARYETYFMLEIYNIK